MDIWLPRAQADQLEKLTRWTYERKAGRWSPVVTGPQVVLSLIKDAWLRTLKQGAYHGHAESQFDYAMFLIANGDTKGAKSRAIRWFSKSLNQGYRAPAALNNIGIIIALIRDLDDGIIIIEKAALGSPCALYNLGVCYTQGWGVPQDDRRAAAYLQQSAEKGLISAQRLLAVLYALGKGVPQDLEKAIEWLRRGTVGDDASCQNLLATVLSTFPDDRCDLRNGPLAVTIAEKLVQPRRSAAYLETLAAAYAEAGRFDDAVKIQQELLSNLKQKMLLPRNRNITLGHCRKRLQSYINKKPWRDNLLSLRLRYEE